MAGIPGGLLLSGPEPSAVLAPSPEPQARHGGGGCQRELGPFAPRMATSACVWPLRSQVTHGWAGSALTLTPRA